MIASLSADPASLARASLRVEMVIPTLHRGGMETMTARLSIALSRRGHDVGVTCTDREGPLAEELRASGIRVALVRAPGLRSIVRAPRLERWLRSVRPDVVHVHSGTWLKTARAARRAGVPRVVHTIHGLEAEPFYGPLLKRWAARDTDVVVGVSRSLAEYLTGPVGIQQSRVRIVTNGIDTAAFRPGPRSNLLRHALGIAEDAPLVGTVGRLLPVKNQRLLLEAFVHVRARVPDAQLVIVGDGPLRDELASLISAFGLQGAAHLFGQCDTMAAAYRDLDVFVLSSDAEGTPMSLLEAMASGTATASTSVGGIPDVLAHGEFGCIVAPNQSSALADSVAQLLLQPETRGRLAAKARLHVEGRFSEDAMVRSYQTVYSGDAAALSCAA